MEGLWDALFFQRFRGSEQVHSKGDRTFQNYEYYRLSSRGEKGLCLKFSMRLAQSKMAHSPSLSSNVIRGNRNISTRRRWVDCSPKQQAATDLGWFLCFQTTMFPISLKSCFLTQHTELCKWDTQGSMVKISTIHYVNYSSAKQMHFLYNS